MSVLAILNLIFFAALLGFLYQLTKNDTSLSRRVLTGLVATHDHHAVNLGHNDCSCSKSRRDKVAW